LPNERAIARTAWEDARHMSDSPDTQTVHLRKIRSFVKRQGRLTAAQARALSELLPRYGVAAGAAAPLDLDALFGRRAPLVLDIGFGDGEALVTCAANNLGIDYLGVEVHEPGIGHLLLLLEKANLANVRVIARDAADVIRELAGGSVDAVNLFFPDPWPKKRHHKRRLVQPAFTAEIARVLKVAGLFHVATDWADYAEHARAVITAEVRLAAVRNDEDLCHNPLAFRPPTKFERRGRRLGHDVVDFFYRKTGAEFGVG
jgi:tRNA (guanine-N7-)-methyltransferase